MIYVQGGINIRTSGIAIGVAAAQFMPIISVWQLWQMLCLFKWQLFLCVVVVVVVFLCFLSSCSSIRIMASSCIISFSEFQVINCLHRRFASCIIAHTVCLDSRLFFFPSHNYCALAHVSKSFVHENSTEKLRSSDNEWIKKNASKVWKSNHAK